MENSQEKHVESLRKQAHHSLFGLALINTDLLSIIIEHT